MEQGQIIIIFIIFNYLMIKYRNSNNIKLVALVGNYLLLSIALSAYFGVNVNIRMYNFDDVQCTVIPSVAYGFVTGMNLQLC